MTGCPFTAFLTTATACAVVGCGIISSFMPVIPGSKNSTRPRIFPHPRTTRYAKE